MSQDAIMTELEKEKNEIIAAMQIMAEASPEPGEVRVGEVIPTGEGDLDLPMIVSSITGAGIIYIYDTLTGDRSRTNKNMLPTQMSKRREDGSKVFTTTKPDFEPKRGKMKCMLHPDDPKREIYDSWGLGICTKDNLPSPMQRKMHMEHRHGQAWKTIEEDHKEQKEAAEIERQERLIAAAATGNYAIAGKAKKAG